MMPPCSTALLLLVISTCSLGFMSRTLAFPALAGSIGIAICALRFQRQVRPVQHRVFVVLLVIVFALKWVLSPPLRVGGLALPLFSIGVVEYNFAYNVAQAVTIYQLFLLAFGAGIGRPYHLPLYSVLVMTMAGTIPSPMPAASRDLFYQASSLTLAVVAGLCFSGETGVRADAGRSRRWLAIGLSVVVCLVGWGIGKAVYRYADNIDRFLGRVAPQVAESAGTVGFSNEGRLGSINAQKANSGTSTALRIFSAGPPAYLRGRVFDAYQPPRWQDLDEGTYVTSVQDSQLPDTREAFTWYALRPPADLGSTALSEIRIQPTLSLRTVLFTPLETAYIGLSTPSLLANQHGVPSAPPLGVGEIYHILSSRPSDQPLTPSLRARLTAVPPNIDGRLPALAQQLAQAAPSDSDKIQAVTGYLSEHCTYSLGTEVGRVIDPVGAFVFDSRKGHCEFFASACTLLLRCMGVPSRYVTGFVPTERNSLGGYWVARNRDAHAWVEAYIEGHGWITVEATPAAGVPAEQKAPSSELWDYLQYLPQAVLASIRDGSLRTMIMAVWHALRSTETSVLALAGLALAGLVFLYRRIKFPPRKKKAREPKVAAMRRQLVRMDRRLAALGLARALSETLHAFALRVEHAGQPEAADWYRAYAVLRYDMSGRNEREVLPPRPALRPGSRADV